MITVGEKTIKLQIWDTVLRDRLRPDRNPSSPSREATIARPRAPFQSTISPIASHSSTSRGGWRRPRSTATRRWSSWSSATSATWNQSTVDLTQAKGDLRGGSQIRQGAQPHLPGGFSQDCLPGRRLLQEERRATTRKNLEGGHQHRKRGSSPLLSPRESRRATSSRPKLNQIFRMRAANPRKRGAVDRIAALSLCIVHFNSYSFVSLSPLHQGESKQRRNTN